jgi:ribosomal protein S18 acetylase RimI-like enzyme
MTIFPATAGDISDLASIHAEGWKATYAGLVDRAFLDSLSVERRAAEWRAWLAAGDMQVLLARQDGHPAGFISFGRLKTPPPGMSPIRPLYGSEVYAIYLLPEYWRRGIGAALMRAAAETLKGQKQTSLCLWVIEQNTRAQAFYDRLGGQRIGKKPTDIGGKKFTEICYAWRDTQTLIQA